jgi:uncharacterized protein
LRAIVVLGYESDNVGMEEKRTVVIGASDHPERYAYKAVQRLYKAGHAVYAEGLRTGYIGEVPVSDQKKEYLEIDTVTLYVGPRHLKVWEAYIFSLHPKRIIFNPGTENPEFMAKAKEMGIETLEACTLVLLSIGNF